MKLQILGDSLRFIEGYGRLYKISGSAIHPCKTYHPTEWATVRQYIEPYLEKAAPTLVGKRIVIDHSRQLPEGNVITYSIWKDGELIYEGTITQDVYELFKSGVLKPKVSVGVNWMKPGGGFIVGGEGQVIPYAFDFAEFSLMQNMDPGDPQSTLELWEGVIREGIEKSKIPPRPNVPPVFGEIGGMVQVSSTKTTPSEEQQRETENLNLLVPEPPLDPIDRLRRLLVRGER